MIWTWIIGALAVFLAMLLSSELKGCLRIIRHKSDDEIVLDVHGLYGLLKRRLVIPVVQFKGFADGVNLKEEFVEKKECQLLESKDEKITKRSIKESFDHVMLLLKNCFRFHEWMIDTLAHVHCSRFYWKTSIGVGDAAETALTTGMVWGLKTSMMGFLFRFIKLDARPEISVKPQYNKMEFSTEVLLMVRIRLFYVAGAGIRLLYRIIKIKGGLKTWRRVIFKS
jgi:hypothetical protein